LRSGALEAQLPVRKPRRTRSNAGKSPPDSQARPAQGSFGKPPQQRWWRTIPAQAKEWEIAVSFDRKSGLPPGLKAVRKEMDFLRFLFQRNSANCKAASS
jgi:hypothetical protein